ncbi:LuxR C-terminal-related transcriptional regulator [Arthrobacter pityocampae]|uniref:LuxR C-terminal-related transcriptional regulator n=1 Tax=Arthrobacter pityocampae TaxID=547334 RepID=UPI0037369637
MNILPTEDQLPCRRSVVHALLGALQREGRQGALVVGETGMGKSWLLRTLERSLPPGGGAHVVRASRALRSVPYGALDDVLAGVPAPDLPSAFPVLRAARQRLRGADGRPGVVLVDDAQFLDDETTHVLTELVVTGRIRLVAFTDHSLAPVAGLSALANEGYLDRVQLEPLTDATLRSVAGHALGSAAAGTAPLGARALLRLRETTGGNPMLLRAVLDHAVATAARPRPDGHPELELDLIRYPPTRALTDLVASVLAPLPEAQRAVLDVLALGGAVPTLDVECLAGVDAVRALIDQRFVAAHPADAGYLTLRHGLYGEVLRATLPLGRKALLHAGAVDLATTLPPYQCHRLRHLDWALDAGAPVDAAVLLDAARVATALGLPETSERFLRAVPGGDGHAAAVDRARPPTTGVRPADAAEVLAGRDAGSPADLLRARVFLDQGRPEDVLGELPAENQAGRTASRAAALALRGGALGMLGRAVESVQSTQAALDAVLADPYPLAHLYEDVLTHHVLVLAHTGATTQALAALADAETAVLPFGPGEVLRGIVLVRRGDVRDGMRALVPGLTRMRRDRHLLLPYALGVAAWGAAVLGEAEQAAALVTERRALPPGGRLDLGILGHAFAAAAESLADRAPAPIAALLAQVRPAGLRTCEKDLLVLAVLLGVPGATDGLPRAVADLQGEEALLLADLAAATGAGDGAALGSIADRAAAVGLPLIALTAALRAGEMRGGPGTPADGRAVARRLRRYSAPFVGTHFEVQGGARRLADLTRSEAAVARRVAAGESNRDIAQALYVSVRTVEGHLHRTYAKLGLDGRAQLVREVRGLRADPLQTAP